MQLNFGTWLILMILGTMVCWLVAKVEKKIRGQDKPGRTIIVPRKPKPRNPFSSHKKPKYPGTLNLPRKRKLSGTAEVPDSKKALVIFDSSGEGKNSSILGVPSFHFQVKSVSGKFTFVFKEDPFAGSFDHPAFRGGLKRDEEMENLEEMIRRIRL